MAAPVDAYEMMRRFGGGPKTAADQERRDAINAAMGGRTFDDADVRALWPQLQALLAEIERERMIPARVAANALCIVAQGGKVARQQREFDPAAVWLAIRSRGAAA